MRTTKVFKSGNSVAVRLPKDFIIDADEVEILKNGENIIIRKIPKDLSIVLFLFQQLPDDCFTADCQDSPPQERDF